MAAPAHTWEFAYDLYGNRTPIKTTLKATANMETKVGTLLGAGTARATVAGNSFTSCLGLAAEATDGSTDKAADDPIEVYILAPGMVIKGTADADATALAGFSHKRVDFNAAGDLDVGDTTGGCATVHKIGSVNTEVYVMFTSFAHGPSER